MTRKAFRSLLTLSLGMLLAAAPAARAADEMVENPGYKSWAGQKVGTTVTAEMNTEVAGQKTKVELTQKLVELTKEKAVVEVATKIPGVPAQPQKQEIPAKVKKADATPGKMPEGFKGTFTEKGKEKVTVAGKSYECTVSEFTGEGQGMKMSGKTWTSDKIPGGLAKNESTASGSGFEMKSSMAVTKIEAK